jgi:hypothetical protein
MNPTVELRETISATGWQAHPAPTTIGGMYGWFRRLKSHPMLPILAVIGLEALGVLCSIYKGYFVLAVICGGGMGNDTWRLKELLRGRPTPFLGE